MIVVFIFIMKNKENTKEHFWRSKKNKQKNNTDETKTWEQIHTMKREKRSVIKTQTM